MDPLDNILENGIGTHASVSSKEGTMLSKLQYVVSLYTGKFCSQRVIRECCNLALLRYPHLTLDELTDTIYDYMYSNTPYKISLRACLQILKYEKEDVTYVIDILRTIAQFQKEDIIVNHISLYSYLQYKDSSHIFSHAGNLILKGVAVVEVIPQSELSKYQKLFDGTLLGFPEYRRNPKSSALDVNGNPLVYVAGGFAALGNPASFHNPFVRKLRRKAFDVALPIMTDYITFMEGDNTKYVSSLPDRMMYRKKGQAPVAEAWHRDVMPPGMLKDGDEIFGGWINLDSKPQFFSCVLGSHANKTLQELDPGFATLEGSIRRGYRDHKLGDISPKDTKSKIDGVSKNSSIVSIPPGYMIVFPQYILHEVVAKKASYDVRRLFTEWRLSAKQGMLYPEKLFEDQGVIPLPGGMIPPMFSRNHLSYFQTKPFQVSAGVKYSLEQWSESTFEKECLVKHKEIKLISRHMKSLRDYGLEMYHPYTNEEMAIYKGIEIKRTT